MIYREATIEDIQPIMVVRFAVKENILSNPNLVTDEDSREYLTKRGKGWVCEIDGKIVGFAIADLKDKNIWALFIHPKFEKKGIGRRLHTIMLDWYFQHREHVWLGTAPHTRAEQFYIKAGWTATGMHGTKEIKFEMNRDTWNKLRNLNPS